jgi:hypothetical protein
MLRKKLFICLLFCLLFLSMLPAQESLKSAEEEYYDFLALQGLTERPTLNYRTLSDSKWNIDETAEHPWQKQNLGIFHPLFGDFRMRVYGPDLFMSANTAAPYGQNDGVLWQGRGFNALFKGGVRFEGYGVELTLLPHFAFSQNASFDIMPSHYDNEYGYFWGYGEPKSNSGGVDAPQRFGDKPFFDWDFGDSEIRYTWKTLTIGFGTQVIWLGPAYLNPILHSNNAPTYPKLDVGLRRQRVKLPWLGWYLGDVEARIWIGRLTESDYFDGDDANDYTMFHGLAFAYAPSFLPGLTLFFNRVCLVDWTWENLEFIFPAYANTIEDQKMSFGFLWMFPSVGFEVYGELGIDDYVPGELGEIRRPFHTTVYGLGLKKTLPIIPSRKIYGELLLEFNWMEKTMEYAVVPYSFYAHHQIIHGYTNKGQWLGNGVSPMGNAQSLRFTLYYPNGNSSLMISRNNPNTHYIYEHEFWAESGQKNVFHNAYWANFNIDLVTRYFISRNFQVMGGMAYNLIINPDFRRIVSDEASFDTFTHNFSFQLGLKYSF